MIGFRVESDDGRRAFAFDQAGPVPKDRVDARPPLGIARRARWTGGDQRHHLARELFHRLPRFIGDGDPQHRLAQSGRGGGISPRRMTGFRPEAFDQRFAECHAATFLVFW